MVGVQEALLACPKMRIIDPNIKKARNIVMERDLENPTPTIDIEQFCLTFRGQFTIDSEPKNLRTHCILNRPVQYVLYI